MFARRRSSPLTPLALCLLLSLHAQAEDQRLRLDLPQESLERSINSLAKQAGVQILFASDIAAAKTSPALKGDYTLRDALNKLLSGTGLTVQSSDGKTFVVTQPQTRDDTLPEVAVQASAANEEATATSPVRGYVAKRSATGSKTDSLLIEVPQSISVITADEIGDRKAESIDEVLRYTAGATPNQRALGSDDSSLLRGFEIENTGIFLDGMRNSGRTFGATIEPYGLERLEVLRGPASVLYGQIPPGGMINAVSKHPTKETLREVGVEYGSYQRKQLKADLGGALDEAGQWSYRLTMLGREGNTRLDHDKDNRLYIAPSLTWQPSDATKLTLQARYQKDNQQYAFPNQLKTPGAFGQIDPSVNFSGYANRFERENKMLGLEFEHAFNDTWTIRQKLRYNDLDNTRTDLFPLGIDSDGRSLVRYFFPVDTRSKSVYSDTAVQARFSTGSVLHTAILGYDYSKTRNQDDYAYVLGFVESLDVFDPRYSRLAKLSAGADAYRVKAPTTMQGVYLQDQLKWDKLVVTAGLRYDKAEQSITEISALGRDVQSDLTSYATTGRIGAVYLFESGLAPYANYATSFAPELGVALGGGNLKPSEGKQFELGVRYQPPGRNISYSAAVFDIVKRNVTSSAGSATNELLQSGEVRSRGLELESRAELSRDLSLVAQYTYLDTEVTKSNNGDQGLWQRGAPKNSASLWAKRAFSLNDSDRAYVALGVRYLGKARSNSDFGNENLTNPSFTILDAAFGVDHKQWRYTLNVNNLLNKEKLYDCGYFDNICYRSAERTANLSAIYRF